MSVVARLEHSPGWVTAVGGGSIRDIMVGEIPPPALRDEALLWAIAITSLLVFLLHRWVREGRVLYLLDTVSLALFAALGAERGIAVGLGFGAPCSPVRSVVSAAA